MVNKITALAEPVKTFRFYHPGVFELLQLWLNSLPAIWQSQSDDLAIGVFAGPRNDYQRDRQQLFLSGLKKTGMVSALDHAFRQSRDLEQFKRQMHIWFDAFRTLKLIHSLRDQHLLSVSYTGLQKIRLFIGFWHKMRIFVLFIINFLRNYQCTGQFNTNKF